MNNNTTEQQNKILERVKKMMALGNCMGTTEHERDAAMQQAYKLLVKFNLTEEQVHATDAPERRDTYKQAGWSMMWCREVCHTVADLFFCEYFYNNSPGGGKINATKCYHFFVGKESNAKTAMHIADHLLGGILKEGRGRYGDNLCAETRSFALGCASKLRQRVAKLKAEAAKENDNLPSGKGTALVLASLYASEKKNNLALLPEKLKVGRAGSAPTDIDAYHEGRVHGDKLSLNVRIGSEKSNTPQLK